MGSASLGFEPCVAYGVGGGRWREEEGERDQGDEQADREVDETHPRDLARLVVSRTIVEPWGVPMCGGVPTQGDLARLVVGICSLYSLYSLWLYGYTVIYLRAW